MNKLALLGVLSVGVGLFGCHRKPVQYPAVPPVTVTATPAPAGVDYTPKTVEGPTGLKKRVAVARFEDNIPVGESPFGHKTQTDILGHRVHISREEIKTETQFVPPQFTEKLVDSLARTKRFVLIERKNINDILREVSFGETKWVDKEKSAKIGKILGAQIIITGAMGINDNPNYQEEGKLALFLRMYDVETSRVVGSARAYGRTEQEVIDRAVSELVITMDHIPWVGRVASASGEQYYINAGRTDNVKVGDKFEVFSLGKAIYDPETKELIGYEEEKAGKAEVIPVNERISTVKVSDVSRSIKVGDKIQPLN